MVDLELVRRLALTLPEAVDASDAKGISIKVGGKGFVWRYMARVASKAPRVLNPTAVAIRCPLERKDMLIEAAPQTFFDDDHYRGFSAVLVRLATVEADELEALLKAAWRMRAPKALLKRIDAEADR